MIARAFLLLILISSFPSWSFPRAVNRDEAMRAAERIIGMENADRSSRTSPQSFSIATISELYYDSNPVAYLVTLNPTGFMILSDITELAPERFISYDSDFADLREHGLIQFVLEDSLATKQRLGYLQTAALNPRQPKSLSTPPDEEQLRQNEALWGRTTQAGAAL